MDISLFEWQHDAFYASKAKFNAIPAGRRTGKTQGAALTALIFAANGDPCLWVDTINSNIDRYIERYFVPPLQDSKLSYKWNVQKKLLKIENGYIDFRSADRPESIEGFGYRRIFLNEAGIILKNEYLYTNAILPMLLDFKDSQLYAFGTPKGKINRDAEPHRFHIMWESVLRGDKNYAGVNLTSYDNPLFDEQSVRDLEDEMSKISPEAVQQEIYAQFLDANEELVFNYSQLSFFSMNQLNIQNKKAVLGSIDVADEGTDSFSFPIGTIIGDKIFITDWLFTKENTDYTTPQAAGMIRDGKLDYVSIETNNHGSVVMKDIEKLVSGTTILPIHQQSNKHSRIIANSGFIRSNFVFREDFTAGSDYDKAMKQLFTYTKSGKIDGKNIPHDDAPDALAQLAAVARDIFGHIWY